MLQIKQAIIVEGKYDKIKLASLVKAVIIQTNGFQIYKNQELLELIRYYARTTGIIILTDSDRAGFQIRNYIKGAVSEGNIKNIYIPDIFGKEKRKIKQSAEGKLGVEGIDAKILREAFQKAGVLTEEKISGEVITKLDLYLAGLNGSQNSALKRRELQKKLNLPELLSATSLLEVLNSMMTKEEFWNMLNEV
ncbi:MAG: DUF4093 domain-containing protein [Oscillospiraceae bacterium]|nr:DUF4093 domain-containing protein [Oscillospiraceae bacterium]MDE6657353.1 DUF4093 domain-containing protein [Oscillospiraceae bacterium]